MSKQVLVPVTPRDVMNMIEDFSDHMREVVMQDSEQWMKVSEQIVDLLRKTKIPSGEAVILLLEIACATYQAACHEQKGMVN